MVAGRTRLTIATGTKTRLWLLLTVLLGLVAIFALSFGRLSLWYQLNSAERQIRSRQFEPALASLARVQATGTSSAHWHFLQAKTLRRLGRLSEASTHLQRADEFGHDPSEIAAEQLLAQAQGGQIKQVRPKLVALLQTGVTDQAAEEIYEAMTKGFMTAFDVPEATRCLNFWTEFQPDNPYPHLFTADLCERLENTAGAAEAYERAVAADPASRHARLRLAKTRLAQLQLDEAKWHYELCLQHYPDSPEALVGLADILRRQGLTEQAKSLLCDALIYELSHDLAAETLTTLGQLALEERQYPAAAAMLAKSVELAPFSPSNRMVYAGALAAVGDADAAAQQRQYGTRLRKQNDLHKELVRQLTSDPNNADLRTRIGLNLLEQGLGPAGADWLQTALRVDPQFAEAHRGLARYYRTVGDEQQARRHENLAGRTTAEKTPDEPPSGEKNDVG